MFSQKFLLIIISFVFVQCQDPELQCPDCNDPDVFFEAEFDGTQCDVEQNFYYVPDSVCGCFPNCEERILFDVAKCSNKPPQTYARGRKSMKCAPGLICDPECNSGCFCFLDLESCNHYNFLKPPRYLHEVLWKPKCLSDEKSYAPVQCKGEKPTGRCFCFDKKGNRIFGEQWWRKAENMTCACSRKRAELIEQGRNDVTLHCDSQGNYEPVQCDSEICWCAEPKTGQVIGTIVPEYLMEKLPCYNETVMGEQYLRKCESEAIGWIKFKKELEIHGTTNILLNIPKCDADGSYGNYQFYNDKNSRSYRCTWKDNTMIESWQQSSESKKADMNCNCARDYKKFQMENLPFNLQCMGNGDYMSLQEVDGKFYCVDADGFAVSEIIDNPDPINNPINCTNWIYQMPPDDQGDDGDDDYDDG